MKKLENIPWPLAEAIYAMWICLPKETGTYLLFLEIKEFKGLRHHYNIYKESLSNDIRIPIEKLLACNKNIIYHYDPCCIAFLERFWIQNYVSVDEPLEGKPSDFRVRCPSELEQDGMRLQCDRRIVQVASGKDLNDFGKKYNVKREFFEGYVKLRAKILDKISGYIEENKIRQIDEIKNKIKDLEHKLFFCGSRDFIDAKEYYTKTLDRLVDLKQRLWSVKAKSENDSPEQLADKKPSGGGSAGFSHSVPILCLDCNESYFAMGVAHVCKNKICSKEDRMTLENFTKLMSDSLTTCCCGNPDYIGKKHQCKLDESAIKKVAEELFGMLVPKKPYKCPVCDGAAFIKTEDKKHPCHTGYVCHACDKGVLWK